MDKNPPLITIIIPAYNSASTICRAVDSALSQTWREKEVIVIDDGSQDNTAGIVQSSYAADPRVRLITKTNHGVSAARNDGIKSASGSWFMTLDADDYIDPPMLKALLDTALLHNADTALCGFRNIYSDGRTEEYASDHEFSGDLREFADRELVYLYDLHLISTHSNQIYKTSLVRKHCIYYNEKISVNEDIDFVLRYLAFCSKIAVVKPAFLNYVQHGVGESLINTFRDHGIMSSLIVSDSCTELLDKAGSLSGTRSAMADRMFVHVCSFTGLMYSMSGYSDERELSEIRSLCRSTSFVSLLKSFSPRGIKTGMAYFLLKHHMCTAYHFMCRLFYRAARSLRPFVNRQE